MTEDPPNFSTAVPLPSETKLVVQLSEQEVALAGLA